MAKSTRQTNSGRGQTRFSEDLIASLDAAASLRIRAGAAPHRFIRIWVVVVNGRAFVRSTDAGVHFTDMTWDATTNPTPAESCCQPNAIAPNGMHPDSHAIVEVPGTDSLTLRLPIAFQHAPKAKTLITKMMKLTACASGNSVSTLGRVTAIPNVSTQE